MAGSADVPTGGELNAAVTSAMVGIHTAHLGRGPRSASTMHHGNVLVTLMNDVMTPAEKTLASGPKAEAVVIMRHLFQEAMESDYRAAVERITGRKVVAFISGNNLTPDVAPNCSSSTARCKPTSAVPVACRRSDPQVLWTSGPH